MKKNIRDIFDSYRDETVDIMTNTTVSADRIVELTKSKIKEDNTMIEKPKRKWSVGFIAAALIAVLSCTAFAAYYFLSPKDVAERLSRYELAECFTKDGVTFDLPAQTSGDYRIELLGMTSGKNLDEVADTDTDKTYIVGAVTRTDGEAITEYTDLMISPLVAGYAPWQVNIFTIGSGGKSYFLDEGVEYFLIECDNISIFADRTVYIAVYEGMAPDRETFAINEDGSISFNEGYTGVRALFEAPLDKSKADPEAVKALLKECGFTEEDLKEGAKPTVDDNEEVHTYVRANDETNEIELIVE